VRIWQTADHKHLTDVEGDGRRVRAIAFSPDDSMLATGGDGPFVMLWNPQNGKLIHAFVERPGKTFSLAFCTNELIASGESDNMVRLWNPATKEQTATLSGHTGTVSTMTYDSKTGKLITGGFDASLRFWQVNLSENVLRELGKALDIVGPQEPVYRPLTSSPIPFTEWSVEPPQNVFMPEVFEQSLATEGKIE
jgi:WD40 repeat protein